MRRDAPAILTIHGDADDIAPYEHGYQLSKALREAGADADAELTSVHDGKHGFTKAQWTGLLAQSFQFLCAGGVLR